MSIWVLEYDRGDDSPDQLGLFTSRDGAYEFALERENRIGSQVWAFNDSDLAFEVWTRDNDGEWYSTGDRYLISCREAKE